MIIMVTIGDNLVINKALDKYIKVYTLTTEYYANIIKMKKFSMY